MKCNHARFAVALDFWREMLTEGNVVMLKILKGIPKDAQFVRTWYDGEKGIVYFIFAHPSFAITSPGDILSVEDIVCEDLGNKTLLDLYAGSKE